MNHHCLERKKPKRFQSGDAAHFFPQTESDMFRHKYFEALDLVINCVKTHLDQPGFKVFRNVEELLVKGVQTDFGNYCDEFSFVTEFYKTDIKKEALKVQLETMRTYFERKNETISDSMTMWTISACLKLPWARSIQKL